MSNIQFLLEQQRNKEFSNNSSPVHRKVVQKIVSPHFKVEFDHFPSPKALSEQSEVRDLSAPEQKLSLLSLPAQKNRIRSRSLQQKSDQYMSGRNSKQDLPTKNITSQQLVSEQNQFQVQSIVKRFLGNLKMSSPIWFEELNDLPLLEEKYIRNELQEVKKKTKLPYLINYIFIFNHFISFILFPIQAIQINIETTLFSLNILILITEFTAKILIKKQFDFTSILLNCISVFYIVSYVMLKIKTNEYLLNCMVLYINILLQYIYVFINKNKIKSQFVHPLWCLLPLILYINLITTIWISIQMNFCGYNSSELDYLNSFIYMVNNILPFNNITSKQQPTCYEIEQIYIIFVQFLSIFIEIYQIYTFINYLPIYHKIKTVQTYFNQLNVPTSKQVKYLRQITKIIKQQENQNQFEIDEIMTQVPITLQKSIEIHVKTQKLMQSRFFKEYFSTEILEQFANVGELYQCQPNELLPIKDSQNQYCYLIIKGKVAEYQTLGEQDQLLTYLSKNNLIGLTNLFYNCCNSLVYKSYSQTILLKLNNSNIFEIIRKNQSTKERFYQLKYDIIFNSKYQLLLQNCSICSQDDHCTENCPKVHFIVNQRQLIKRIQYSEPNLRNCFKRTNKKKFRTLINSNKTNSVVHHFRSRNHINDLSDDEISDYTSSEQISNDEFDQYQISNINFNNCQEKEKLLEANDFISPQTFNEMLQPQEDNNQLSDLNRFKLSMKPQISAQFAEDVADQASFSYKQQPKRQNSNTLKSSSGKTHHSQKSSRYSGQRQRNLSQQNSKPPEQKQRVYQPTVTFQYDPTQQNENDQFNTLILHHGRQSNLQNKNGMSPSQHGLPVVQEENTSSNHQFYYNNPLTSAVSLSSVGEDLRNRGNSFTLPRISSKQNTIASGIMVGQVSCSQSILSSQKYCYQSNLEEVLHIIKSSYDLDKGIIYENYKPFNNYDIIVNQVKLFQMRNERKLRNIDDDDDD